MPVMSVNRIKIPIVSFKKVKVDHGVSVTIYSILQVTLINQDHERSFSAEKITLATGRVVPKYQQTSQSPKSKLGAKLM